jgi:hypothetical protein
MLKGIIMSLDMNVFVESVDDSIIEKWMEKINQLGMSCEVHPEFSFNDQSGFLPFKINLSDSKHSELNSRDFYTGFEFYLEDFDLGSELEKLKPKKSIIKSLFRKEEEQVYFANEHIDKKLANCKKVMHFVWGTADTFELRMALLSSAIISEILNGVCCYAEDGVWYENENLVKNSLNDVKEYEESISLNEFEIHEFKGWA